MAMESSGSVAVRIETCLILTFVRRCANLYNAARSFRRNAFGHLFGVRIAPVHPLILIKVATEIARFDRDLVLTE